MQQGDYKYWAFISYSHADERWAGWLHRALEGYRIPAKLVGRETPYGPIPRKLFPVFRDRDELAGSAALGPELQKALHGSRSLIVICSPRSAQSHWVNEEIKHFKSIGRADRVFALIVDGEPHALAQGDPDLECFPEALRYEVDANGEVDLRKGVEPIAADARRHADGKGHAKLKLIAGVLGVGFDDLRRRELQARNRRLGLLTGLAMSIAALTLVLAFQASLARDDAQRRQRQAEDLIQFMLGDLRKNLEPIGKLSILDSVGDKAMEYFGSLGEEDVTDSVLLSRATALRQIGDVRAKQGKLEEASQAFQEALKLDLELVERHPQDSRALVNVAESEYSVGYAHYARGDFKQAREWFGRQLASLQRLVALEPDAVQWTSDMADALTNLGGVAQLTGEIDVARDYFERARQVRQSLVEKEPDNQDYLLALSGAHGWLTHLETGRRRYDAALEQARQQNALLRKLVGMAPDHADYRHRLAAGLLQAAYTNASLGTLPPDDSELAEAMQLTEELMKLDASNVTYARLHGVALFYLKDALLRHGQAGESRSVNDRYLELARELFRRAPDNAESLDDLMNALIWSAKLEWLDGDAKRARALVDEALALPGEPGHQRGFELQLLRHWLAENETTRELAATEARRLKQVLSESGQAPKPELLLRYHALQGELQDAGDWVGKLTAVERAHPYLRQFCRELNLRCEAAGAG